MHIRGVTWVLYSSVCLLIGCGAADLGESCDGVGETDDCVDGAVCTNESDGNVCRKICDEQEDCPDDFNCNGLSGDVKSCQPG
jgi:hypothetical protein